MPVKYKLIVIPHLYCPCHPLHKIMGNETNRKRKKLVFLSNLKNETTYADISAHLAEMGVQNCSSMSVRRFYHCHNLSRRGVGSDTHLELAVARSINQATPIMYRLIIVIM